MDDILFKSLLYDFYGGLLTEKQKSFYKLYFFENLTLGEIGGECGISPQAAGDLIRRVEKNLSNYEDRLGYVAKYLNQSRIADGLCAVLDELGAESGDKGFSEKLLAVKAGITDMLKNY